MCHDAGARICGSEIKPSTALGVHNGACARPSCKKQALISYVPCGYDVNVENENAAQSGREACAVMI